jgi:hypothetical protein
MSKWDTINVQPEIKEVVLKIAENEGMKNYTVVTKALKNTYPQYFKVA